MMFFMQKKQYSFLAVRVKYVTSPLLAQYGTMRYTNANYYQLLIIVKFGKHFASCYTLNAKG
jgi:hypothetical protein